MKKIIMAIAATAMLASAAFAEVSIGGWGRAYFVPVWMTKVDSADAEIKANANEVSWGAQPAGGFTLTGGADDIKASLHLHAGNGTSGGKAVDAYTVTATPFDFLTVVLGGGDSHDDVFRGKGPNFQLRGKNTSWSMWALNDGSDVFSRVNEGDSKKYTEIKVNFEPVTAYAVFYNDLGGDLIKAEDMYKNGQYGIGANLDGIGLARAQWIGRGKEGTMEAAFALTSVENLYLDIGVKYATEKKLTVTAVPQYNAGDFGITAGLQFVNDNEKGENSLNVYLQPTYNLGNGYSLLAEAIFTAPNLEKVSDTALIGANCFINKGLSSGKVGAGVCFSYFMDSKTTNFGVPVFAEYWF